MIKPKLKKSNYHGFKHEVAIKSLKADKFINYMAITNFYGNKQVCAVYHSSNPDLSKGHKEYPMLIRYCDPHEASETIMILARTKEEIEKDRIHNGILCLECNTIVMSLDRHDYQTCGCPNETMMTGGQEPYGRIGGKDMTKLANVQVDMINNKWRYFKNA